MYGLWFAAPMLASRTRATPERLAATMVLGTGLPFALGFANILTGSTLWLGIAGLSAVRVVRFGFRDERGPTDRERTVGVAVALAVMLSLVAPVIVRPLMDGDTLAYHLPLAASFVAHHGIWTTGTRYWWYPAASELFASGLYATSGIRDVGLAGVLPAMLLVTRIAAMRGGGSPVPATALACGLLATDVVARELVSLQNDVWLAALFVECATGAGVATTALLALVKPHGIAFAAATTALRPTWWRGVAAMPVGLWAIRDVALAPIALVPIATTSLPRPWATSIAFHLPDAWRELPAALAAAGVGWSIAIVVALVGYVVANNVRHWVGGAFATFAYLFVPFGYSNLDSVQFADGQSFRFALPAVALGVALFAGSTRVSARVKLALGGALCLLGIARTWHLYASDAMTFGTPGLVVIAVTVFARARVARRDTLAPLALAALAALAAVLSGVRPAAYFDDRYGSADRPTHAFAWLAAHRTPRIVTDGVPSGAVLAVAPDADVGDVPSGTSPCADAARRSAWLVFATSLASREPCLGRRRYRDRTLVVVDATSR